MVALAVPRMDWRRIVARASMVALGLVALVVELAAVSGQGFGADAWVYSSTGRGSLYVSGADIHHANFIYSPAFAQAIWPLAHLPAAVFVLTWMALGAAAFAWLLAPLPLPIRLPFLAACWATLWIGNIEWLLALTAAVGLRHPATWAVGLLTKVTPGIALLWFAVRREWRALGIALGATLAIAAASALLVGPAWTAWVAVLAVNASHGAGYVYPFWMPQVPWLLRAPLAVLLVAWGARTDRMWTIPAAIVLAQPDLHPWTLAILAALPRLYGHGIVATPTCDWRSYVMPATGEPQ
jgi:hypothetical protein